MGLYLWPKLVGTITHNEKRRFWFSEGSESVYPDRTQGSSSSRVGTRRDTSECSPEKAPALAEDQPTRVEDGSHGSQDKVHSLQPLVTSLSLLPTPFLHSPPTLESPMLALGSAWKAGGPPPTATLSPLTMGPTHGTGRTVAKVR